MAAGDPLVVPRRPRGRPKGGEARQAILAAAFSLLEEDGLTGFTIEGVAARAGAAKTTIYRWWPSREALAVAAFLDGAGPSIAFPRTESASADIRAQMQRVAATYGGRAGRIVRGLVLAGLHDSGAAAAFINSYVEPRRAVVREVLARGIARGEFRAGLDVEAVIDALYGPVFYRLLVGHGPLDADWIGQVADTVLAGCRPS